MVVVFYLSIMFNIIGGQLDERLNAFLATCHVVIRMLYVITCESCGKQIMMMLMIYSQRDE